MIHFCFCLDCRPTTRRHVVIRICYDVSLAIRLVNWGNMTLVAGKSALLSQKITLPVLTQVRKEGLKP